MASVTTPVCTAPCHAAALPRRAARAGEAAQGRAGDQRPQPVGARRQRGRPDDLLPLRLGPVLVAPRPQPRGGQAQVVLAGEPDRAVHLVRDAGDRARRLGRARLRHRDRELGAEHAVGVGGAGRGLRGGRRRGDLGGGQRQRCCTAWNRPIGRPNCTRSPAYRTDAASARPQRAREQRRPAERAAQAQLRRRRAPRPSDAVTGPSTTTVSRGSSARFAPVGDRDVGGVDQQHVVARRARRSRRRRAPTAPGAARPPPGGRCGRRRGRPTASVSGPSGSGMPRGLQEPAREQVGLHERHARGVRPGRGQHDRGVGEARLAAARRRRAG